MKDGQLLEKLKEAMRKTKAMKVKDFIRIFNSVISRCGVRDLFPK